MIWIYQNRRQRLLRTEGRLDQISELHSETHSQIILFITLHSSSGGELKQKNSRPWYPSSGTQTPSFLTNCNIKSLAFSNERHSAKIFPVVWILKYLQNSQRNLIRCIFIFFRNLPVFKPFIANFQTKLLFLADNL